MTKFKLFALLLLTSLSFSALSQEKAKHFKELQQFLPSSPLGFTKNGDPDGASLNMGEMSYSMAEQQYQQGNASLDIVISDYKDAAMILEQQTMAWNMEYEDTDTYAKSFEYKGHRGWETFQKTDREAAVFLVLNNRYMVYASMTEQSGTDKVKEVLDKIALDKLVE